MKQILWTLIRLQSKQTTKVMTGRKRVNASHQLETYHWDSTKEFPQLTFFVPLIWTPFQAWNCVAWVSTPFRLRVWACHFTVTSRCVLDKISLLKIVQYFTIVIACHWILSLPICIMIFMVTSLRLSFVIEPHEKTFLCVLRPGGTPVFIVTSLRLPCYLP